MTALNQTITQPKQETKQETITQPKQETTTQPKKRKRQYTSISFAIPKDILKTLFEEQTKEKKERLSNQAYYLLGILYYHNIFKTNPKLAVDVLWFIASRSTAKNYKDELLKMIYSLLKQ